MKILWSPLALGQVQEIAEHIAHDKPGAARRWAEGVFRVADHLASSPKRGRVVPEIGREEIRELLHGNYRIIYRVEEGSVSILTVRHGRRLLDKREIET
jgi:plasmid stabilization system protein ParE